MLLGFWFKFQSFDDVVEQLRAGLRFIDIHGVLIDCVLEEGSLSRSLHCRAESLGVRAVEVVLVRAVQA